jgi:hypothetical protein
MRFSAWAVVVSLVFALAGCSAATLGSGRVGGTGGSGGAGGSASTSPGTVTLHFALPPGQTFCDENPSCSSTQHLWVGPSAGQPLSLGTVGCSTPCSTCLPILCPEIPVIACPAGSYGSAVTDSDFTWDGSYVESSSCENTSAVAISCVAPKFAAPGLYVARFCATPGTLSLPDGGLQPQCTPTGAQSCVEVSFAFPSSQSIAIDLP